MPDSRVASVQILSTGTDTEVKLRGISPPTFSALQVPAHTQTTEYQRWQRTVTIRPYESQKAL